MLWQRVFFEDVNEFEGLESELERLLGFSEDELERLLCCFTFSRLDLIEEALISSVPATGFGSGRLDKKDV